MRVKYELSGAVHMANARYVEEIPADAITGEAVVVELCGGFFAIDAPLPESFLGKRVRYIIIPEEVEN